MKGAFTQDFGPAARADDYVRLDPEGDVYQVRRYDVLPGISSQTFEVDDGDLEQFKVDAIAQSHNWLAQVRMLQAPEEIPADVEIRVDHGGRQKPKYNTKNERGVIDADTGVDTTSDVYHSQFTELYVHEDNPPYFTVVNQSGDAIDFEVTFTGYRYLLTGRTVDPGNEQPVTVPIERIDT